MDLNPCTKYRQKAAVIAGESYRGLVVVYYHATHIHNAGYATAGCLSVRPSVRPSHGGILSSPLNIPSNIFLRSDTQVATPFWFFHTKRNGNMPVGAPPPNGSVEWWKKSQFSTNISYISETIIDTAIVTM